MRRLLAALTLAMAAAVCGNANAADIRAPLVRYDLHVLSNGLKVYSVLDRSRPEVAVQVWYDVGSRDDPPGRAGLAHLFEHLMFKGSPGLPADYLDEFPESVGGSGNASTTEEYTSYEETVPASELERGLWAEAVRMNALVIDRPSFESERAVVEQEVREIFADDPYGRLFTQDISQASFASPALRQSPAGSIHDLQAVTLADVAAFKARYYRPDNAVLIVVGDFDPAQLRAWIERYFGVLRSPSVRPPRAAWAEPPRHVARRVVIGARGAPAPAVVLSYAGPTAASPDAPAVRLLDQILAGDGGGRGKAALVERRRIATEVFSDADLRQEAGLIYFGAIMAPGHGLGEGEAALRRQLAWLQSHGVSRSELATAKAQLLARMLAKRETLDGLADEIGEAALVGGGIDQVNTRLAALQAVTPADIDRVARAYCIDRDRVTIRYGAGGPSPSRSAPSPKTASDLQPPVAARPAEVPALPPRVQPPAPELPLPVTTTQTLANGLRVIVAPRAGLPVATAVLSFVGGSRLDPRERPGLTELTASLALRGAAGRSDHALARALAGLGLDLSVEVDRDSTRLALSGLSPSLPQGLALLADVARRPSYDPAKLARAIRARAEDDADTSAEDLADEAVDALVFRQAPTAAKPPRPLSRADLVRQHARLWRPDQATLVITGSVEPNAVIPLVRAAFDDWRNPAGAPPTPRPDSRASKPRVVAIDWPGAAVAAVEVGARMAAASEGQRAALELANTTLGDGVSSRLSREIRVKRGLSYDVSSDLDLGRGTGLFSASTETRNATAPKVASLILEELRRLAASEMTPEELTARKAELIGDYARRTETTDDLAELIAQQSVRGAGLDDLAAYAARIRDTTAAEVRAAAVTLAQPGGLNVVIVGDVKRFRGDLGTQFPAAKVVPEGDLPRPHSGATS
ncbi:MAG TPA: pitrilysin family protein [Caulobacteraceae bacterium]|jgi:zinc protease